MNTRFLVVGAALVTLILRVLLVVSFSSSTADGEQYIILGRNIREHHTLSLMPDGSIPTYARNPGYPAVVSLFRPTEEEQKEGQHERLALVNCAFDALTAAAIVLLALQLGLARRIAIGAIALWIVWPAAWWFTPYVVTEPLATALGTWALVVAFEDGLVPMLVVGVLLGLGYLVRIDVLTLVPAIALIRWRRARPLRALAAMSLAIVVVATPWWIRNLRAFGELHPAGSEWVDRYGFPLSSCYVEWFRTWSQGRDVDSELPGAIFWHTHEAEQFVFPFMADSPEELAGVQALAKRLDAPGGHLVVAPKFCALASERARSHPLRTFVALPIRRARHLFTLPRVAEYPMRLAFVEQHRTVVLVFNTVLWAICVAGIALTFRRRSLLVLSVALGGRVVLHAFAVPQFVGPRFIVEAVPFAALLAAALVEATWQRVRGRRPR